MEEVPVVVHSSPDEVMRDSVVVGSSHDVRVAEDDNDVAALISYLEPVGSYHEPLKVEERMARDHNPSDPIHHIVCHRCSPLDFRVFFSPFFASVFRFAFPPFSRVAQ